MCVDLVRCCRHPLVLIAYGQIDATATCGPSKLVDVFGTVSVPKPALQKPKGTQNNSDSTGRTVAPKRSKQVKDVSRVTARPKLADFHLLKCLGEGSYGTVHLSQHKPSSLTVALKAISKVPRIDECGSRNLGTKALERRLKKRAGDDTQWVNEVSTNEIVALLRVAGEGSLLQPFAFFHDLRYFYIATVSSLS